jgi:hypothetical protein
MLSSVSRKLTTNFAVRGYKVAVCGAAGGIGQVSSEVKK